MLIERSVIVCQFKLLVGNKMNRVDNWISLNSNIWNLPYLLVKVYQHGNYFESYACILFFQESCVKAKIFWISHKGET